MHISKTELIAMEALWAEHPLTVGQAIERLQAEQDWHENTIKTLLLRLVKKGAVERYKDGKRYFYKPIVTKDDILSHESEGFLGQFFDGKMAPLVAHFAKNKKLSAKEAEEIKKIIDQMSQQDD